MVAVVVSTVFDPSGLIVTFSVILVPSGLIVSVTWAVPEGEGATAGANPVATGVLRGFATGTKKAKTPATIQNTVAAMASPAEPPKVQSYFLQMSDAKKIMVRI